MRRGAPHAEAGRKLIDYLLSVDVERQMADSAAHIPLRDDVPTPKGLKRVRDIKTMRADYARIASDVERIEPWLRQWAGL